MYFARTFRALSASALLAAPLLSGCTQDLASQESALVPICPQAPVEVVTFNDFSVPLGVGFNVVSDKPQLDPGHSWTVVNGKLLSDPAGFTIANYYNRLDTPAVDLAGKSNIRVRLKHRFQHTGIYQLFAFDSKGNRSLLRELGGANPQYPGYLIDEINVPASYASSGVRFSLLLWSGGQFGSRVGVEVAEFSVVAGTQTAAQTGEIVYFDNFETTPDKFRVYNSPEPASPDHKWASATGHTCFVGHARTDSPQVGTISPNYTRLETGTFSLVGKTSAQLTFQRSMQIAPTSRFQVFSVDNNRSASANRSLIGEYWGTGPNFPGAENVTINLPSFLMGSSSVQLAFLLLSGTPGDAGVAIDNIVVSAK